MKKLLLIFLTLFSITLSSQSLKIDFDGDLKSQEKNQKNTTHLESKEVDLRLNGLNKFGKQHRMGNHLVITGMIINTFGLLFLNGTQNTIQQTKPGPSVPGVLLGVGSVVAFTGAIINIDSFRHLRTGNDLITR
jgi:hypothetical protein